MVLPEVFLKALSAVRNLGHAVRDFTTVNLDFLQHYRPRGQRRRAAPRGGRRQRLRFDRPSRNPAASFGRCADGGILNHSEYEVPLILAEPEAPFWGFGEIFVVVAVFLVSLGVVGNLALSLLGSQAKLGYWSVAQEAIAYGIMLLAMKVIFFWRQQPLFRTLGWTRTVFGVGPLAAVGFSLFLLSVLLQLALRTPEVSTPFEKMLRSDTASRLAITFFGITLGPAIEELLFRGFLQPVLVNVAGVFPGILHHRRHLRRHASRPERRTLAERRHHHSRGLRVWPRPSYHRLHPGFHHRAHRVQHTAISGHHTG